jgi:hypothetical protein
MLIIGSIVGAEMIIRYNDLTPDNTLKSPGQIIPLAIRIIVLVDGLFKVWAKLREVLTKFLKDGED